ncbi:TPA: LOW QUALITY PROTEIN: hypothetical protein N0F65_011141 [Lagenidium giganteum]|uniref:ELMO domain-containing protein n=1 Tax=Lagenidium giganteum TaxID=4803 RepID=A0AAV2Z969_9STRA|nr:TPA: LOW QUALITY PROTEIN: hypothetical protein N0F65_011141 [Lagenidium giganteum]
MPLHRRAHEWGEEDNLNAHLAPARGHAEASLSEASDDSESSLHAVDQDDWKQSTPTYVQLPSSANTAIPPPVPSNIAGESQFSGRIEEPVIDPEVFAALPEDIQAEILMAQRTAEQDLRSASWTSSTDELYGHRESSEGLSEGDQSVDSQEEKQHPLSDKTLLRPHEGWICHVCTFQNHPELLECEMCDTMCLKELDHLDEYDMRALQALRVGRRSSSDASTASTTSGSARSRSSSSNNELYKKISKRFANTRLRNIRLPVTPATTTLTNKEEPTAEDFLIAATMKLHQFQSNATQRLQQAKKSIIAKANSSAQSVGNRSRKNSTLIEPEVPSDNAAMELNLLQQDLGRNCEPGEVTYEALLERLWQAAYRDVPANIRTRYGIEERPFERVSTGWTDLGFQETNPDTDFRGGGMLALKCLVYAFEAYPQKMLEIVTMQKPSKDKKWYPVCVAGINLTCMIAGLLKLGNGEYEHTPETFWKLFEEPAAFFHVFFVAFVKMDAAWARMNASYMEFNAVMKATRQMVIYILDRAPQNLNDLRDVAERTFIDRYVSSTSSSSLDDCENGECPDPYHLLEDEDEVLLVSPRSKVSPSAAAAHATPVAPRAPQPLATH